MPIYKTYSKAVSNKHQVKPTNNPLIKKHSTPTPAFCKLVEQHALNRNTLSTCPKAEYRLGIRILFAECYPMLLIEIAKIFETIYPNYSCAKN